MKKFTQKQFDGLPRDEGGIKQCPTGDYAAIKKFPEWCSFGKWCSFGEGCSFGEWCSFGKWCKATSPLWDYVFEPPFQTEGKILPTEQARGYWEERLGVQLPGCYAEIEKLIVPKLPDILKRTDLTKCERRVLESWQK